MSNGYQREVVDFLRDYGATTVEITPGGKHPKVEFDFRGKHRTYTIAATPSDHRASANMISELKRMLGNPIKEPETESRRLVDMLPEAVDRPTYQGKMACYMTGRKKRLRFLLPRELIAALGIAAGQAIAVSALDKDTWHLHPVRDGVIGEAPVTRYDSKQLILDTNNRPTPSNSRHRLASHRPTSHCSAMRSSCISTQTSCERSVPPAPGAFPDQGASQQRRRPLRCPPRHPSRQPSQGPITSRRSPSGCALSWQ
jgi:hypothetical protein